MTAVERSALPMEVLLEQVHDGPVVRVTPAQAARSRNLRHLLFGLDSAAAVVGWALGLIATSGVEVGGQTARPVTVAFVAVLLAALTILAVTAQRLYLARVCTIRAVEIGKLGKAAMVATAASLVLQRFLPVEVSTPAALFGGFAAFSALNTTRALFRHWLQVGRRNGRFLRSVVVVGTNEEGYDLCKLVNDHPEMGYRIAGVIGERDGVEALGLQAPWLGPIDDSLGAIRRSGANGALLAASAVPARQMNALVRALLRSGVHVHLSSGVRGIDHRRLRAQPLAHEPLFYLEPLRLSTWQLVVKRLIDVVVTVVGGVVLALPTLAVAAVMIKLQDRGPVLYKQVRVGRHGRQFTVYKLRTMAPNADALYDELARTRAGRDGPLIKLADDPRRTKVGRLLERLSIDELPQLWNVLRGEMSLVGPRPAQPSEVARFDEELMSRHEVPPGLTGLWQVEARDNPSFAAYRRFDLFYIENWSVSLDLAILVATVQRVLLRGLELVARRKPEMAAVRAGGSNVAPAGLD